MLSPRNSLHTDSSCALRFVSKCLRLLLHPPLRLVAHSRGSRSEHIVGAQEMLACWSKQHQTMIVVISLQSPDLFGYEVSIFSEPWETPFCLNVWRAPLGQRLLWKPFYVSFSVTNWLLTVPGNGRNPKCSRAGISAVGAGLELTRRAKALRMNAVLW